MWFRISWILLVVAHFAVLVASKGASAAYEKIWLYYAYQIAFKLDGPSQAYILRQLDPNNKLDKKYTTAINNGNRGSLKDGMMTWNEFQWSLNNLGGKPDLPQLEDDLDKTAQNIWNSVIKNMMMVNIAATHWDPNKNNDIKYNEYIDGLGDMIIRARSELGDDAIADELKKIREVSEKIVHVRGSEFRQDRYLGEHIREKFPGIVVHTYDVSNPVNPSKILTVVDLGRTMYDPESEAAIKFALDMVDDTTGAWKKSLMDSFYKYGTEPFSGENSLERETPAQGHRTVLTVWEKCLEAADVPACK